MCDTSAAEPQAENWIEEEENGLDRDSEEDELDWVDEDSEEDIEHGSNEKKYASFMERYNERGLSCFAGRYPTYSDDSVLESETGSTTSVYSSCGSGAHGHQYESDGESFDSAPYYDINDKFEQDTKRAEQILIEHMNDFDKYDGSWQLDKNVLLDPIEWPSYLDNEIKQNAWIYERDIHLSLLRTCQQIYTEFNQVLWETNIFSFSDITSFIQFMGSRSTFQKSSIRKLRLAMNWDYNMGGVEAWNSALSQPLIRSLEGLRELWLHIHYCIYEKDYQRHKKNGQLIALTQGAYLGGIRRLATLPLTRAHVDVVFQNSRDLHFLGYSGVLHPPWTEDNRKDFAALLRARLLDPRGAELYAQETIKEKKKPFSWYPPRTN